MKLKDKSKRQKNLFFCKSNVKTRRVRVYRQDWTIPHIYCHIVSNKLLVKLHRLDLKIQLSTLKSCINHLNRCLFFPQNCKWEHLDILLSTNTLKSLKNAGQTDRQTYRVTTIHHKGAELDSKIDQRWWKRKMMTLLAVFNLRFLPQNSKFLSYLSDVNVSSLWRSSSPLSAM